MAPPPWAFPTSSPPPSVSSHIKGTELRSCAATAPTDAYLRLRGLYIKAINDHPLQSFLIWSLSLFSPMFVFCLPQEFHPSFF